MAITLGRGISQQFISTLQSNNGLGLNRVLHLVKNDTTLCLEIRKGYINIYYRGGNLMKLTEDNGCFTAHFDAKYISKSSSSTKVPPAVLLTYGDVTQWIEGIPLLKHEMDRWFGKSPKNEREFQQLLARENNFKGTAKGTDYFICDIEYASREGRFDLIAAYWPSSRAERKKKEDIGLALIEMKYMDKALTGSSGIIKHINDMINYCNSSPNRLASLKDEMKIVFNQKQELGLIDNQNKIVSFSDRKPEYIFVLANHDPDSKILYEELRQVAAMNNNLPFDLKFAAANFMGYGLYKQNLYELNEFMKIFSKQIYSYSAEEN